MAASRCLRDMLKSATRAQHDALDAHLSPLAVEGDYRIFMEIQHAARAPAESWLGGLSTEAVPPLQSPLIAMDLAELGAEPAAAMLPFHPQDHREALGVIWALAGSSLGNRAILQRRRKRGEAVADRFLSDPAMPQFWAEFRPRIEREFDAETAGHAITGARRMFITFLTSYQLMTSRLAA
ncbi:biliverdin-producing heme oxygenase [Qipengyuania sp. 6B39]|uniref:biliverdin-producing heme oxygenase n=1 Tax=Qipengyuania proteolytica TaxID=2867239 RepID=UPI001C8A3C0B|nr:biliverdin-producing heme oxygenase [Qipengyuania proteolytica]MBX7497053.1 biliverdin-producing heme oxygenase [Qipengyuania proteolytica]